LTCGSVEEAELERARLALDYSRGRVPEPESLMTVGEFWPVWRADAEARLAEATMYGYDRLWIRLVGPRFADVAFADIRPRYVAAWRGELLAAGIGRESVRMAMVLLQAMFTVAIEWGEAETNPVMVVRKPKQGRSKAIRVIAPDTVERIRGQLLKAGDLQSATMVSVLAYTGMRPGEMLGLELNHIRRDTILVEQAVAYGKLKPQKTGRVYRTIDLLDSLAEDLAVYSEHLPPGRTFLFGRRDNTVWQRDDYNNWRNRRFHVATKALGLGTPRPYDLRHSIASLRIREKDVSIVELASQLGHAPTETLKTYAHVFSEFRRQQPRTADELIREARLVNGTRPAGVQEAEAVPDAPPSDWRLF
jgi:integrase